MSRRLLFSLLIVFIPATLAFVTTLPPAQDPPDPTQQLQTQQAIVDGYFTATAQAREAYSTNKAHATYAFATVQALGQDAVIATQTAAIATLGFQSTVRALFNQALTATATQWTATPILPTATATPMPFIARTPTPTIDPDALTHRVIPGDTPISIAAAYGVTIDDLLCQNRLTEDHVLEAGQVLVIPGPEGCTLAPPSPTPPPTVVPQVRRTVLINTVSGAGALEAEAVILTNEGSFVNLAGWTLVNEAGDRFVFPDFRLFHNGSISVFSGSGEDSAIVLYWGREQAAFAPGETVTLRNERGDLVDSYVITAEADE